MAALDAALSASRRYDELLDRRFFESTVEQLALVHARHDLLRNTAPVCTVLRPQFLSSAVYRRVQRAASLVMRGIFTAFERLLVDAKLRELCGLDSPLLVRLMRLEHRQGAPHVSARLDGFLAADGSYKIIEYSGTPGGILYGDVLAEAFAATPIMAALRRRHRLRTIPTGRRLLQAYRQAHADWGGVSPPRLVVLDGEELAKPEHCESRAIVALLRARGFLVDVVTSSELAFRGGRLLANGRAVDALYYVTEDAIEETGEDAIIRALERRAVWLEVGPRAAALFSKAVFAILSDPVHARHFAPEVAGGLARHVPWTRVVREAATTHAGRRIDLVPYIEGNRERLVLKPAAGNGGKGVVVGTQCSAAVWRRALNTALSSPHVVQERVELGTGVFPYLDGRKLAFAEYAAGLDPYTWSGRTVSGCLVRLSRGPILNVAAGSGSMAPLFLVD